MLHSEGRDHIWAYYTRNLVRPVALARRKVDVIIGNPPWINYNQTASILRAELERQSKERYGIWQGGKVRNAPGRGRVVLHPQHGPVPERRRPNRHGDAPQRVADGAVRQVAHRQMAGSGAAATTLAADFTWKAAWDLERLEPNTFFPVPASVAFAKRLEAGSRGPCPVGQR